MSTSSCTIGCLVRLATWRRFRVQFSKRHTNNELIKRVNAVKPLWTRLRLSASHYKWKVTALKMSAWPRALHGIEATTVSLQAFKSLRAGATRGLGVNSPGSYPAVHLGMVEHPSADPHCWSILQTLRAVRACSPEGVVARNFAQRCSTHTLLARITKLQWTCLLTGQLSDAISSFDLMAVGFAELVTAG